MEHLPVFIRRDFAAKSHMERASVQEVKSGTRVIQVDVRITLLEQERVDLQVIMERNFWQGVF